MSKKLLMSIDSSINNKIITMKKPFFEEHYTSLSLDSKQQLSSRSRSQPRADALATGAITEFPRLVMQDEAGNLPYLKAQISFC